MAMFVVKAYAGGKDIICQCEYGQSKSAGCAAAILEYFYHNGISIFADYKYYFAADTDIIKKRIAQLQFPETLIADYKPENSHSVVDLKKRSRSNCQREISFIAQPKK